MVERYLIASLGSIGRRHLSNLRRLRPKSEIAVLRTRQDAESDRLPDGADRQFHAMAEALAFAPKAAIIASPATLHLDIAAPLLEAGVPLLIEKPLAAGTQGVRTLLRRYRSVPVAVGYNLRMLPSLAATKALISAGEIGDVLCVRAEVGQYLPDWRAGTDYRTGVSARRDLGGGALLELSHELDYLCWMFGLPDVVTACGGTVGALEIDVEDAVELCLLYEDPRRLVNVHLDFLQRAPHRSCRFIGSEGTLIWDGLTDRIQIYHAATRQWEERSFPPGDRNDMYVDELREFLAFSQGASCSLASAMDAYGVLATVDAARESLVSGRGIRVTSDA